jgi:hypothetical protein
MKVQWSEYSAVNPEICAGQGIAHMGDGLTAMGLHNNGMIANVYQDTYYNTH